jgi:RNA polymerase sigma factor (sigma-70 family)
MAITAQPFALPFPKHTHRSTLDSVALSEDLASDETGLARRAVAGDGDAFAELYSRYEKRAYNLCLRIVGSEADAADATQEAFVSVLRRLPKLEGRDLAFGSYLFTSARHACYDLIERRRRAEPSDEIAEGAIPVGGGVGGGGLGFEPGDPGDDPERNVLLEARQDEIREANLSLPERQREVLVLKEVENLSYDEIADIMDMNRNSVAQLISRARINLRDALRGTALASIATSSADCERAIALLAAEQDRQPAEHADWLRLHMADCETCRLSREAMEEAGVSYRAWLPVAAAPLLFRETMARAAGAVGEDWSDVVARHEPRLGNGAGNGAGGGLRARLSGAGGGAAAGAAGAPASARAALLRHRRLDLALIGGLAAAILLVLLAATVHDGTKVEDARPTAEETQTASDDPAPKEPAGSKKKKQQQPADKKAQKGTAAPAAADEPRQADGQPANDEPGTSSGGGTDRAAKDPVRKPQGGQQGSTRGQNGGGGGGGENLAGDDPPVVTDPPDDPPVVTDPPDDPPVTTDPPVVVDPPTRPTCGIPGTPPCPRVPGITVPPRQP